MNDENKKPSGKGWRSGAIFFAVCLVILAGTYGVKKVRQSQAEKEFESLRVEETTAAETTEAETETPAETEAPTEPETEAPADPDAILTELGIEIPDKAPDWETQKKVNEDIYAWIYIPGTKVDYPILQHPSDDSYYLEHNLDGSKGLPGCIYTELQNDKGFMDHQTVLYGHNMKNGTMFRTLHNFEDSDFFKENRYAFIWLPDGRCLVYDIYAAYIFGNQHLLNNYNTLNVETFQEYLDEVSHVRDMNAHFRKETRVTGKNHIITMCTCINDPARRYLVQGVLINDWQLTPEEQRELYGS